MLPPVQRAGWVAVSGVVPVAGEPLTATFAIRQRGIEELQKRVLSDAPHLSMSEVRARTDNPDGRAAVLQWLRGDGGVVVLGVTADGQFVRARAPVHVWTTLLSARFRSWHRSSDGGRVTRADTIALPGALDSAVAAVFGLTQLPPRRPLRKPSGPHVSSSSSSSTTAGAPPILSDSITPAVLRQQYGVPAAAGWGAAASTSAVAIFEGGAQYGSPSDLALFRSQFATAARPANATRAPDVVNGHWDGNGTVCAGNPYACFEGNLDVQVPLATYARFLVLLLVPATHSSTCAPWTLPWTCSTPPPCARAAMRSSGGRRSGPTQSARG